jgi:hypothetical protein
MLLNYRKKSVWDLLINETLDFARSFQVDGIMIDNAHICPHLLKVDWDELGKKDHDGEYHYPLLDRINGTIVKGAIHETNFDSSPSPLLYKLAKTMWLEFPEFIMIGDMTTGSESKKNSLIASGVIPRTYELPEKLALIFGKRLEPNGTVEDCDVKDVSILRNWYEDVRKDLHPGALTIESSSGHALPYPALIYGRGSWVAVDILLIMPDVPMSFMHEQEGYAYRLSIANYYSQDAKVVAHSLSALDNMKQVLDQTKRHISAVSPEFGFDLKQIKAHYEHRRQLRQEREVLKIGTFVHLHAYSGDHQHRDVLTFAKFTETETAVFVINMRYYPVQGEIDLSPIKDLYQEQNIVFSIGDFFVEAEDDIYFFDELFTHRKSFNLQPYSSQWWLIAPSEIPTKVALEKSFERLKSTMDLWQDTSSNYMGNRICEAVENKDVEDLANILGIAFQRFFKKESYSLHHFIYLHSRIREGLVPQFFSQIEVIAGCKGVANDAILGAQSIIDENALGPIVFPTPEIGKWSTAGGLGVMVDELSLGLAMLGEEVWVISPYYHTNKRGQTDYLDDCFEWKTNIEVTLGAETLACGVYYGVYRDVHQVFIHREDVFPKVYCDGNASFTMR